MPQPSTEIVKTPIWTSPYNYICVDLYEISEQIRAPFKCHIIIHIARSYSNKVSGYNNISVANT